MSVVTLYNVSMRRADRLFQIVLMLGRGKVLTASTLAERLEVSARTIYRDVQDLSASGVPIEGEAGVGYCLRGGYQVPPMMFDEEELQVLAFSTELIQRWGDAAMASAAERIVNKVDAVIPQRLRPKLSLSQIFVPDAPVPRVVTELLGQARAAIKQRQRFFLNYQDAADQRTERIVWPLGLVYWGGLWTLAAWCELRNDFRTFRIDRIESGRVLESTYPSAAGRQLDDYFTSVGAQRQLGSS